LAPQAETALSALWSGAGRDSVTDIASIIEMGATVIAGLDEGKIAIAA
jgi:chemotaxis response regulator CheB